MVFGMLILGQIAAAALFGQPEPIDWERKRLCDEQRMREMTLRQLELATGRDRLDIAVNGLPETALSRLQR